jgi:hypothetical protein
VTPKIPKQNTKAHFMAKKSVYGVQLVVGELGISLYDTVNSRTFREQYSFKYSLKRSNVHILRKMMQLPTHQSLCSTKTLHDIFGERMINWRLWPSYQPDMTVCNFYMQEHLKQEVYSNNLCTQRPTRMELGVYCTVFQKASCCESPKISYTNARYVLL